MVKKTWKDFKKTGLLLIVNQILHVFGWAIAFKYDDSGNLVEVFPARVTFRGFYKEDVDRSYKDISKYMLENAETLYNEIQE